MSSNYPLGAVNDPRAPYNEEIPKEYPFIIKGKLITDLQGEELETRLADFYQWLDNIFSREDGVIVDEIYK